MRFLAVGVLNTCVGLTTIFLAELFGASAVVANACGYGLGLVVSFTLNRRWTFRHTGPRYTAQARFLAAFAVAYTANVACVLLATHLGARGMLAQVAGVLPYTLTFYLLSRYFVFRTWRPHATEAQRRDEKPMQTPSPSGCRP